jgi:type VI secretion system protein ImpC
LGITRLHKDAAAMRDRPSGHRIQVDLSVDPEVVDARPEVEAPFCIALFGDFSARGHRGIGDAGLGMATREPVLVDRDNLDEILAGLRPELHVPLQSERDSAVRVRFTTFEDFHPDRLYERLPVFEGVRELRRRLAESAPQGQPPRQSPAEEPPAAGGGGNLLDQILQQSPAATEEPAPLEGGDLQAYLNRIVAPYLIPAADPRRQALLAELDAASARGLRALLHHPDFQALEALWRGVHLITQGVESDTEVRLYLFDVTKAELAADQRESADAAGSRVYRRLAEPPAAAPESGWGALGGLYSFAPDAADLELLGRLATVARLVGAPWISAADPRLAGCDSIHSTPDPADWVAEVRPEWQAVRRIPDARWIGLAMPRFLLRLPYGERGSRCEALPFEELSDNPAHEEYLWGNPAFPCLLLLAQAIAASGRPAYAGMNLEVGGLPLHVVSGPGGTTTQSCAEAVLGERAAERIMDGGLMPLISTRDSDRIRLMRFQSISEPLAPLRGRWMAGPQG